MPEILGMLSIPSLPLLPGPLWLGVVVPDRVMSTGQIELIVGKQMIGVRLWLLSSNTWNHLTVCKKELVEECYQRNVLKNPIYI